MPALPQLKTCPKQIQEKNAQIILPIVKKSNTFATNSLSSNNKNKNRVVNTLSFKTISANKDTATKEWVVVDAADQVLGRLGAKVASLLRGKHKPNFTPHVDCGDNVIIINASKVRLTGNKWNDRVYLSYSGYPGGQKSITPARLKAKPNGDERLLRKVVKGMLPKNKLGAQLLGNMYVYSGGEHKHEAQTPKSIDINLFK
jgi:large subunit ribosomal protein L13